jgi:putative mRNA 3-end processing factor
VELLTVTNRGLYCALGDFHIDPWEPVDFAIITHAHSDHARWGSRTYLCADSGTELLRRRIGPESRIESIPYGQRFTRNEVTISLHPAGHILGSAQVRLEYRGEVWVVTGDYRIDPDPTCSPFELVPCHTLITESTFGLPIYHWDPPEETIAEVLEWWRENQERGWTSILYAYSLGKAQRLLKHLDQDAGPLLAHGAVYGFLPAYQAAGVDLSRVLPATPENAKKHRGKALVVAPPSADGTPWMRKFGDLSTAFASGWMQIRGTRRRKALDRGFAFSDHVDWAGLNRVIKESGAESVWVTHGYSSTVVRWLEAQGKSARVIATRYEGEQMDAVEAPMPLADNAADIEGAS